MKIAIAIALTLIAVNSYAVDKPELVLRCVVDTVPSSISGGVIPPSDVVLSADATLPVKPAADAMAGLPDAPEEDVAGVSITPGVKQGDGADEVSTTDLDKPHKGLEGQDLFVWNQFCRGRSPAAVGNWRYGRCNGLDSAFTR
jgi:hypothetical protein